MTIYYIAHSPFTIHPLIAFPNCKINLGLNVIRKRDDNFHDIETVFYPVELTDVLEIIANENNSNELTVTGLPAGDNQDNLCLKAYDIVKQHYPQLPFIKIHLHKAIPSGAGLGGGSADAAFTLRLLKEKILPQLTTEELNTFALQLGSDCPFFLYNKSCFATGRGEKLTPVNIDLSSYKIILVNPGIHISTAWAFNNIQPFAPQKSISEIIAQPIETWQHELHNDFEQPVFKKNPEIKKLKELLYNSGATYASLTGSGSTVYGIFDKSISVDIDFPQSYFTRVINPK